MIQQLKMTGWCIVAMTALSSTPSFAAEDAKSIYLLGVTTSMAGMTPPPGFYASSFTYLYGATATGNVALSRTLGADGHSLPSFISLETSATVKVKAQVALDVVSALYVAPEFFSEAISDLVSLYRLGIRVWTSTSTLCPD
jgi:hypothetical protein